MRVLIPVPSGGVSVRYLRIANERFAFRVGLLASGIPDERMSIIPYSILFSQ
jgi:hypothetical protein